MYYYRDRLLSPTLNANGSLSIKIQPKGKGTYMVRDLRITCTINGTHEIEIDFNSGVVEKAMQLRPIQQPVDEFFAINGFWTGNDWEVFMDNRRIEGREAFLNWFNNIYVTNDAPLEMKVIDKEGSSILLGQMVLECNLIEV